MVKIKGLPNPVVIDKSAPVITKPDTIQTIKEKHRAGKTLSLEEMIIWNAAKLNSWAYCTKHRKKYRFHDGCADCNNMCKFCGEIVPIKENHLHHLTCTKMPKKIKKNLINKFKVIKQLGSELDKVKALPDTAQNQDRANNLRSQISRL